jgi:transposase
MGETDASPAQTAVAHPKSLHSQLRYKRLERGRFVWPSTVARDGTDRIVTITPAQLGYLLEGIDWRLPQHTWRPQAAG